MRFDTEHNPRHVRPLHTSGQDGGTTSLTAAPYAEAEALILSVKSLHGDVEHAILSLIVSEDLHHVATVRWRNFAFAMKPRHSLWSMRIGTI